jgi:hypothetical protein
MTTCAHHQLTVPSEISIKAAGTQEIIGVAHLRYCIECDYVVGYVSSDSGFSPRARSPVEGREGTLGVMCRAALL